MLHAHTCYCNTLLRLQNTTPIQRLAFFRDRQYPSSPLWLESEIHNTGGALFQGYIRAEIELRMYWLHIELRPCVYVSGD